MNVAPELEERVMLQCSVPPFVGSVEGRYWSPRLVAKSCAWKMNMNRWLWCAGRTVVGYLLHIVTSRPNH